MACFWEGQDPETSYITHFLKVSTGASSVSAQCAVQGSPRTVYSAFALVCETRHAACSQDCWA